MLSSLSRRAWLAALPGLAFLAPRALAGAPETRAFAIRVDDKKCGDYYLTVQEHADDVVAVAATSNVRVTFLGVTAYEYTYRGLEVWKAGRLLSLESSGKEKGKEFSVSAKLDGDSLLVRANGKQSRARADVWASSCWKLPPVAQRNAAVTLLGSDNGTETAGRLDFVAHETIQVAGASSLCARYRVTKDVVHDVWYDAQERLVRDQWTSNGHRTVVELVEVRK